MLKISELVDKNLLDVNSARDFGKIVDVSWDKQSGTCAFATVEGVFVAEKVFSVKDAVSVVDAIAADEGERLVDKLAYDTTGKLLGKIVDVEFGNTLKLSKIYLNDDTAYNRGKIYAVKDVMLIRAKTPVRAKKYTAKLTAAESAATDTDDRTSVKKSTTASWLQNRKYGDFSFLIGKVADKSITNFQGEVMIKYGERVTHDTLRQAKVSGKLIELCLHTK